MSFQVRTRSKHNDSNPNHRDVYMSIRSTWYAVLSRITIVLSRDRLGYGKTSRHSGPFNMIGFPPP